MSKKVNTWEIGNAIEDDICSSYGGGHGSIFEELSFGFDAAEGEDDESDDPVLDIWFSGEIEHPMSGYGDSYNTEINVEGKGKISKDGKITCEGTYKMEVGTATYIDELDELRKISSTAKVGKEKSFDWEADDASDFLEGLAEIPQ